MQNAVKARAVAMLDLLADAEAKVHGIPAAEVKFHELGGLDTLVDLVAAAALIEALKNDAIAGAGLDVYDVEPLPKDHPIRDLKNAVLTGHTGYVVQELYTAAYGDALENIQAWMKGAPVRVLNEAP